MKISFSQFAVMSSLIGFTFLSRLGAQPDHIQLTPQQEEAQRRQDAIERIPFDFYGKVVDESGNPVAGATAQFEIATSTAPLREVKVLSDQRGIFSIKDVRAVDVHVLVYKRDSYTIREARSSSQGGAWGLADRTFPTETNPATWVLRKKLTAEPLNVVSAGGVTVSPDGTPTGFNLMLGRVQKNFNGGLQVQCWIDAHDPKAVFQQYHWKFRVSVPGGGLQLRQDKNQFLAPDSGYKDFDEVELTPGSDRWNDNVFRDYFFKLADGKYAHVTFNITTNGFFNLDAYINPSGSRVLEFDPRKKLPKPKPL